MYEWRQIPLAINTNGKIYQWQNIPMAKYTNGKIHRCQNHHSGCSVSSGVFAVTSGMACNDCGAVEDRRYDIHLGCDIIKKTFCSGQEGMSGQDFEVFEDRSFDVHLGCGVSTIHFAVASRAWAE